MRRPERGVYAAKTRAMRNYSAIPESHSFRTSGSLKACLFSGNGGARPSRSPCRASRAADGPPGHLALFVDLTHARSASGTPALLAEKGLLVRAGSRRLPLFEQAAGGFTLIELLVVIAIIAVLAGLIVGAAGLAGNKSRTTRVQGEMAGLINGIESYKAKRGFYPPDNTKDSTHSPLFYELTGTTVQKDGSFLSVNQQNLPVASVLTIFNLGGFVNSSPDPSEVQNFFTASAKSSQTGIFTDPKTRTTYTLFGVPVPGPAGSQTNMANGSKINLWHYVSSNPTNNPNGGYDLWMDLIIAGKTNRISNWNRDPQGVSY